MNASPTETPVTRIPDAASTQLDAERRYAQIVRNRPTEERNTETRRRHNADSCAVFHLLVFPANRIQLNQRPCAQEFAFSAYEVDKIVRTTMPASGMFTTHTIRSRGVRTFVYHGDATRTRRRVAKRARGSRLLAFAHRTAFVNSHESQRSPCRRR